MVWLARIAIGILILGGFAYGAKVSHDTAQSNHNLICSIADLVTVGGKAHDGVKGADHAQAELDFLTSIRDAHCEFITAHPATERQIDAAIRALEN